MAEEEVPEVVIEDPPAPAPAAKAKAKAKSSPAPKGKDAVALRLLEQLQAGEDLSIGGNLERLQSYLDEQLKALDSALATFTGSGVASYKGTATPAELRRELLYLGKFLEAHAIHKTSHSLSEEDMKEAGALILTLTELYNHPPEESMKIFNERLKIISSEEEIDAVTIGINQMKTDIEGIDPSTLSPEKRTECNENVQKIKQDEAEIVEIKIRIDEIKAKIDRLLNDGVTDEAKEELRNHLMEQSCDTIVGWAVAKIKSGRKWGDVLQYITSGIIGLELWYVLQFAGMALGSFGPKKLMAGNYSAKGKGKAAPKTRAIKTSVEGEAILTHLKGKLSEIMNLLQESTNLELTNNTLISACGEACILSGCDEKGRGLLAFGFKPEFEDTRKMIYARSVAQLTVSDRQKTVERVGEIIRVSNIVENLQRRAPCRFFVVDLPDEIKNFLSGVPIVKGRDLMR